MIKVCKYYQKPYDENANLNFGNYDENLYPKNIQIIYSKYFIIFL